MSLPNARPSIHPSAALRCLLYFGSSFQIMLSVRPLLCLSVGVVVIFPPRKKCIWSKETFGSTLCIIWQTVKWCPKICHRKKDHVRIFTHAILYLLTPEEKDHLPSKKAHVYLQWEILKVFPGWAFHQKRNGYLSSQSLIKNPPKTERQKISQNCLQFLSLWTRSPSGFG